MPLALWALTLSAFAIGTTEFVIVGLVPTIAADLGVSLPSAGLLVSLYAVGVAIGAPILTALTGRWNRKIVLMSLMGLFVIGNLLAWQAPSYETLILARILTGLAHGVFFSIGSMIATSLVSKEKEASAIAIMFTGLTVALVTGVPLGTWIGQHFGWRATFLVVSVLGLIALIGSAILVPKNLKKIYPCNVQRATTSHCKTTVTAGLSHDYSWLWRYVYGIYLSSTYLRAANQICTISHWAHHARIWRVRCYW